jgi:hypothetical protein
VQLHFLIYIYIEGLGKQLGNARFVYEIPEGLSSDCETTRHWNTDIYHLTKACTLAAYYGKIILSDFF